MGGLPQASSQKWQNRTTSKAQLSWSMRPPPPEIPVWQIFSVNVPLNKSCAWRPWLAPKTLLKLRLHLHVLRTAGPWTWMFNMHPEEPGDVRIWSIFYSSQLKTESIGPSVVLRNTLTAWGSPPKRTLKNNRGWFLARWRYLCLFLVTTWPALMQIFHPV